MPASDSFTTEQRRLVTLYHGFDGQVSERLLRWLEFLRWLALRGELADDMAPARHAWTLRDEAA